MRRQNHQSRRRIVFDLSNTPLVKGRNQNAMEPWSPHAYLSGQSQYVSTDPLILEESKPLPDNSLKMVNCIY